MQMVTMIHYSKKNLAKKLKELFLVFGLFFLKFSKKPNKALDVKEH